MFPDIGNVINVTNCQIVTTKIALLFHVSFLLLNNIINAPLQRILIADFCLVLFQTPSLSFNLPFDYPESLRLLDLRR